MNSINPNGFVLWEGNSLFDNKPIVVIITGLTIPSSNAKTGNMLQSWIIKQDEKPNQAIKDHSDSSVCGNCPLREKICYVNIAPVVNIWENYKSNRYLNYDDLHKIDKRRLRNRLLRLGSYGDPCAVPLENWLPLIKTCKGYSGYTHAWSYCDQRWKDYLIASVESSSLMIQANTLGWKTYRIILDKTDLLSNEILCPNNRDKSIRCEDCLLCNGGKGKFIAEVIHGNRYKINNFTKLMTTKVS